MNRTPISSKMEVSILVHWKASTLIIRFARLCMLLAAICCAMSSLSAEEGVPRHTSRVDFARQIRPLLADTCFTCHGPDSQNRETDLRLDTKDGAFAELGGYHAIVPGDTEESEMLRRLRSDDPDERMPPPDQVRQLTDEQIALIERWIEEGAPWNEHWAFVPPSRPELPQAKHKDWPRNGIDHFILRRLERESLSPSPEADRESLIRRVTLDLTGLPPTIGEIDAFLADDSPDAYERVVDRLLASPRYGEHMAVSWLDAARYADTDGYQNDRLRYMWPWRDWVIMALNENMPFDQFTIEQLAGDMLPDATLLQQIATGFNRNHRITSEGGSIPEEWIVEYVVDRVDTTATVWLGLTMGCARCHDHKYDPISQREYYQLFAYYNNVPEWGLGPNNGNSPPFISVPKEFPDVQGMAAVEPAPYKLKTTQTSVVRPQPGGANTVMVMQEMDEPRPTYLLRRGLYNQPDKSEVLSPELPAVLDTIKREFPANRLGFSKWLTDPNHPLTARVTVNRMWQHYFGTGLVKTSENFGTQGEFPSHPQLLDWLATEFIRLKWDMKAMHRLIVTSATYRQSAAASGELLERDPENRLLARAPRLRLPAQVVRDQALFVSGLLVEKIGGQPVKPYMPPKIWSSLSGKKYARGKGDDLYRRSLYTYWLRTIPPPVMLAFDSADRESCTVRKDKTNTPLQALTLMNNVAFVESARLLAERMIKEGGNEPESRLEYGFRIVTSRRPNDREADLLQDSLNAFIAKYQQDKQAAAALLNIGEKKRDESLDGSEVAAYTMVANTLLNLDETITKP